MECLGCRIANGTENGVNIVYEDERITCVLDIDPFNEGHTLILPKRPTIKMGAMPMEPFHLFAYIEIDAFRRGTSSSGRDKLFPLQGMVQKPGRMERPRWKSGKPRWRFCFTETKCS